LVTFLLSLLIDTVGSPEGVLGALTGEGGWLLVFWYLLSFGLAPIYGFVYWLKDEETSLPKAIAIAHVYNLYSYQWFIAGWRGAWAMLRGRKAWAKTARTPDLPAAESEAA
jgi:hypothetical protein